MSSKILLLSFKQIFQDARNTIGNIPMNWYDDYPHIGYDLDGTKIMKPAKGDEVSYSMVGIK